MLKDKTIKSHPEEGGPEKRAEQGPALNTGNINFFFPDHSADTPLCFHAERGKIFSWQLEVKFFH